MKLFNFLYPSLIGMDIQMNQLTVVKVKKIKHKLCIETWVQVSVDQLLGNDNKILNWQQFTRILTAIVQRHGLAGLPAALPLPENLVRIQSLQVPKVMSLQEIQTQIDLQIRQDFPGLVETVAVDFVTQSSGNNNAYCNILYVLTHQDYLDNLKKQMAATGIILKIVDVDLYALERFKHWFNPKDPEAKFIFNPEIDAKKFKENLEANAIACGAALQQVPAW